MLIESVIEPEDKSFYADLLAELTGVSRGFWGELSLDELRPILHRIQRAARRAGLGRENLP